MSYDESLADRIRELIDDKSGLSEKKMFGGVAFLIGGNLAVSASGRGGIMARVDPAQSEALIATTPACLVEMRGKEMPGWLRVGPEHLGTDDKLSKWVLLGTAYARSLPAKR